MSTVSSAGSSSAITSQLGQNQFLQLLVAQLKNQNPLEPVDGTQWVTQLAQFSELQGVEQLNTSFANLLAVQQLTQGANMIGLTATYNQPNKGVQQGTVTGVSVQNGALQLQINGTTVPLAQVIGLQKQ